MRTPTTFHLVHATKPRRKSPERDLHKTIGEFLDLALPEESWHTAIPGGDGRPTTNPAYRKGAPDHLILWNHTAFLIEAKDKYRKPSPAQIKTHQKINSAGSSVLVAKSVRAVEQYLREKGVPLRGRVQ